jgi:hypothetical protein
MLKRRVVRAFIVSAAASVAIPCYVLFFVFPYEMGDGPIPREYPPGSALALLNSTCYMSMQPAAYVADAVLPRDWRYISPPNDNPYVRIPTWIAVVILVNSLLWGAVSSLMTVALCYASRSFMRKTSNRAMQRTASRSDA